MFFDHSVDPDENNNLGVSAAYEILMDSLSAELVKHRGQWLPGTQ
jgi:hypothetical protein